MAWHQYNFYSALFYNIIALFDVGVVHAFDHLKVFGTQQIKKIAIFVLRVY
jgi:hypothetical protein